MILDGYFSPFPPVGSNAIRKREEMLQTVIKWRPTWERKPSPPLPYHLKPDRKKIRHIGCDSVMITLFV
jgi:hypothetical protein